MASSSLASHTTPQPLSYADRAKKAQNIRSTNSLQPSRSVHMSLTSNSSVPTSKSVKSSSPAISKSSSMSSTVADSSAAVLTTPPFQPGPSSSLVTERQVNGAPAAFGESEATTSTVPNTQQAPPKPLTANVWNLRREKMAGQSPQHSSTQSSSSSPHSISPHPHPQPSKESPIPQPALTSFDEADALEPDPFVVRPPPRPPRVYPSPGITAIPPLLRDSDAWPAVGQVASTTSVSQPPLPPTLPMDNHHQDPTEFGTGGGSSKRGEKNKWPPLQADGIGSDKGQRHNARRGSQQNTPVYMSRNNSQAQSRTQSGRTSSTHSVSQSRVNSRTNSAHSSPHLSRSRRLPPDDSTYHANGGAASNRSSGRNSPRPHPFTHRGPTLSVDPNLAPSIATPMPIYGPPTTTTINGTTYFPQPSPIHLPLTVPQEPMQYPHSASGHSPLQPQYMNYPSPLSSSTPPHLPQHFVAPPYPLYPPYTPYDYNNNVQPPYPHWYLQDGPADAAPFPHHGHYPYPIHELHPNPPPAEGVPSSSSFTDHSHTLGHMYDGLKVDPSRPKDQESTQSFAFGSIDSMDTTVLHDRSISFFVGGARPRNPRLKMVISQRRVPDIPFGLPVWSSRRICGAPEAQWVFGGIDQLDSLQVEIKGMPVLDSNNERVPFAPPSTSNTLFPQNTHSPYAPHPHAEGVGDWDTRNFMPGFTNPENVDGMPEMARSQPDVQSESELGRKEHGMGPKDDNFARTRRGSYGGHDRGGGFGRRGRGAYARGFGRGVHRGGGFQHPQYQRQPFNATPPPPHYQPLVAGDMPNPNGYYPPLPHQLPGYPIPPGYDGFGVPPAGLPPPMAQSTSVAPLPAPRTILMFPLDPLRWFLLGQLEYYLSPQNLATDFFLRQNMDSKGWILINLFASFNRIKQLTTDIQLVKDVLGLSTELEIKDNWVRTKEWSQYVLPDAATSAVEPELAASGGYGVTGSSSAGAVFLGIGDTPNDGVQAEGYEEDDEEEEDVVFVMGDG